MTALSQDAVADLQQRIAELERQLQAAVDERDTAIDRQTASALVSFRLKNELRAVSDREKASAEILNAIANTQGDAEHALQRIAETTANFFNAAGVTIRIADGDTWVRTVRVGAGSLATGAQPAADFATRGHNVPGTVYQENRQIHIPDLDNIDSSMAHWPATAARAAGIRTICGTPLRRRDKAIGALIVYRDRLAPFTDDELALQQGFADQAVIAIENARLFNETQQALTRQDATAEILRTVASTPGNAEHSLRQIAETSARLFGAPSVTLFLAENGEWTKTYRFGASSERIGSALPLSASPVGGRNLPGRVVADDRQIHVPDLDNLPPEMADWPGLPHARAAGTRSACGTPLRREGKAIGALLIFRDRLTPFTAQELALQQSFADQAVIAIENARLFNETQEALERQTATSDILKVIASSPSDVQPVFDAIAQSAKRLLGGFSSTVYRFVEGIAHLEAFTPKTQEADEILQSSFPQPVADFASFQTTQAGGVVQIPDTEAPTYELKEIARARGYRSMLFVPLMNKGTSIGLIAVTRVLPGHFVDHHVQLLKTFADQAVIAIENARLFNETKEALERQTATADILKVIASSPSDVQPVFDAIAQSAKRLLGGLTAAVFRLIEDTVQLAAFTPTNTIADAALKADFPRPVDDFEPFRMVRPGQPLPIADTEEISFGPMRDIARLHGFRSMLYVPLMNGGVPIGLIAVTRAEPGAFASHHVQLLGTFADQAVIAIENTRLFTETQEALERQTATADILKVIASSPSDVQPVFEAIASSSKQLIGAYSATVFRFIDGIVNLAAYTPISPAADTVLKGSFPRPTANLPFFDIAKNGEVVQEADSETNPDRDMRDLARARGFRSSLFSPLMSKGVPVGLIVVTRKEPGVFAAHHVQLIETFADQAVIAIENTRLFDQLQHRTDDLAESLQQQTATSEVLQIISSSPGDLTPVFDKMLENATRVCGAEFGSMLLVEGDTMRRAALYNAPPAFSATLSSKQFQIHPASSIITAVRSKRVVQVDDVRESAAYLARAQHAVELADLGGARTIAVVPMLRDDEAIGVMTVYRQEVRPFGDKQVDLLTNFARQAVIAIENARLLRELRQRTDDLSESLQQQTATSEVLQIISSSPDDLTPVFDKMLENATRVCGAEFGALVLVENGALRRGGLYNAPAAFAAQRIGGSLRIHPKSAMAIALRTRQVVQQEDIRNEPSYLEGSQAAVELADLAGARTVVVVPMLRDEEVVGMITVYRQEVRPFSDKQTELLTNFARQAVIAIENARLLRELRQRTDDLTESLQFQTASSDVLKVISRSPDTLQPVLDVIVQTSRELCNALTSVIFLLRDGKFHLAAISVDQSFQKPEYIEGLRNNPISPDQVGSILARATRENCTINIPNAEQDHEAGLGGPLDAGGPKALLCVPLMRDNRIIGAITLRQSHLTPFTQPQIEAVETFADQAVIAISNVNLFEQVQQRTRELTKSLDDLRTAQDRLVQTEKLASLGQLTAGIAHEIKNPLNFVNNFAALSIELTDELNEVLKQASVADKLRAEVDELTGFLKDNLAKVVQHGKRADSIVKNMLLHSREGSGEHRAADVNALVDESLNLAYHGARAEKPQFNVTLRRDFDPQAGQIEVFPQEITRVFLNLLSNGFYAVTKRRADNVTGFEPTVSATTKGHADGVEIRIRDNGTGIPPEVKEKMFNPFFTTKPAGEGTGLGLSMSYDIIVKQHGGTIDVETVPGEFTEFRIVLPRTSLSKKN